MQRRMSLFSLYFRLHLSTDKYDILAVNADSDYYPFPENTTGMVDTPYPVVVVAHDICSSAAVLCRYPFSVVGR